MADTQSNVRAAVMKRRPTRRRITVYQSPTIRNVATCRWLAPETTSGRGRKPITLSVTEKCTEVIVVYIVVGFVPRAGLAHRRRNGGKRRHDHASFFCEKLLRLLENLSSFCCVNGSIGLGNQLIIVLAIPMGFRKLRLAQI